MAEKFLPAKTILSNRYQIDKILGEGSFGITYLGRDTRLNATVAIKECYPIRHATRSTQLGHEREMTLLDNSLAVSYQEILEKYIDEARHLSEFRGLDGVVSVYDFFFENNTAYIIMEYIDGISLQNYISEHGAIEVKKALRLIHPIVEALISIHKTGLIHRDISPDNILITKDENLILIDFGSARNANYESEKSLTVIFKRGFSPAEQYHSRGMQGMWSDIYALCATIYFMLTGQPPAEALERIFEDDILSLRSMNVSLPKYQEKALMKGLSVHYNKRFQSMEELESALYHGDRHNILSYFRKHRAYSLLLIVISFLSICSGIYIYKKYAAYNDNAENAAATLGAAVSISSITAALPPQASPAPTPTPNVKRVPSVVGLFYKTAKNKIKTNNYKCKIRWVTNNKKRGIVIKQNKKGGMPLADGKTITLSVSKGKPKVSAPPAHTIPPIPPSAKNKAPSQKPATKPPAKRKKINLDGMVQ